MLSFSWNAPPKYPEIRESEYKTWFMVEFDYISDSETEITLTYLGWPDLSVWRPVYEYFDSACETVLVGLENSIPGN